MSKLAGKVALVTGAGRGIGKAIALAYAKEGAFVVCAARTEAELLSVAEEIAGQGGRACAVPCDVTEREQVHRLFETGLQGFACLDILVLNAGRGMGDDKSSVADGDPVAWKDILEANLLGAYYCAQEAVPHLLRSKAGKIIAIGSGARLRASPQLSAYAAAKAGLWALVRSLAEELKPQRIAVNELIPGPVLKEQMLTAQKLAEIADHGGAIELPNGEWHKTPSDVASLALFLATQPPLGPQLARASACCGISAMDRPLVDFMIIGAQAALGAALLVSACGGGRAAERDDGRLAREESASPPSWELVWADEFDGMALDAGKWNIQLGDGSAEGIPGWGNKELQTYRADNIALAGGHLVITARREAADGRRYTSGRINTAGKFAARYGRFEASIQMPAGRGLWGAFWMLPEQSPYGTWPASGEIDIMEVYSRDPPFAQGVAHYGMAWPLNLYADGRFTDIDPANGFHVYALEWDEQALRWFIDGIHYHSVPRATYWSYYKSAEENAHVAGGESAPFDHPFHLLVNLAVGGNLPGDPAADALPGAMQVDYVRVYRCGADAASGLGCAGLADPIDEAVTPTPASQVFRRRYDLYDDGLAPLALPGSERPVSLAIDAGGAWQLADEGEGGRAIDLRARAGDRFSIAAADSSRFEFHGMGSATAPARRLAGEVQFDLFVVGAATDRESSLRIGLASGPGRFGSVELPVDGWPPDEWTRVTVQISDILHNAGGADDAVDLNEVRRLFALEFTSAAHVRLNGIKILCAHSQPNGCGIRPAPK